MNEPNSPLFFGEWLQLRRKALDLTQAELAQIAGCSVFTIRKIESGERRPSKQLAELLAQPLNIPQEELDIFIKAARGERGSARLAAPSAGGRIERTAAPQTEAKAIYNLPASLTPFVGREDELSAIDRLLNDPQCRLVTLIGAGGIGKTRLAIEAAAQQDKRFSNGICFVPLASISSSVFLVQAIADALSLRIQGQYEPQDQLLDYLRHRRLLLVLDNFEHLLDGAAFLNDILQSAPWVKLLATSRERLNLNSEWVYLLEGLSVPPADQVERAEAYTSVELFIHSALRAQAEFMLRGEDKPAVVRICQLVEGMPLSIELAAAWVSVLTCDEIAQEIENSFDFLVSSATDVPHRQRSQRAVFDHSWNLLEDDERTVLSKLAFFRGGFNRDAALEVADASLPMLLALTSKSLIRRSDKGRFDIHEAIRQYAATRLNTDAQREAIRSRHSHFYLVLLRDRKDALQGPAQRETISELKREIDNLRLAWKWAVDHQEFPLIGEALRSLGWLCNVGVMYQEGVEQIGMAIKALRKEAKDEVRDKVLGMALAQHGLILFRQGKFSPAMSRFQESLAILRPIGDPDLLIDPLILAGIIQHLGGEIDQSISSMEEGLGHARRAGDTFYTAYALFNLGYVASIQGQYVQAFEQMSAGLAMWREMGDLTSIALGLNHISPTAIKLGRIEEAHAFLQESIALLTEVGDRWGLGTAYRIMGLLRLAQGRPVEAQALIGKSLDLFEGFIIGWDVARSLILLAEADAAAGNPAYARRNLLQGLKVADEFHLTPLILDGLTGLARLQAAAGEVEDAYSLSLGVVEHPAATFETRQRAGEIIALTEDQLTTGQLRSARERAENTTLEATTASLLTE